MTNLNEFTWTAENVETMRKMRAAGHSAAEIARTLKAPSRNAVLGKMNRLGMSERKTRRVRAAVTVSRFDRAPTNKAERIERARTRGNENRRNSEAARKARAEAKRGNAEVEALRAEQAAVVNKFMPEWANAPLPGTKPVKLMDLEARSCRWPLDTEKGTRYCGCITERVGLSYCPSHQAVHTGASVRTPDQVHLVAEMMAAPGNVNSQP